MTARSLDIPLSWSDYWDKYYPGIPRPRGISRIRNEQYLRLGPAEVLKDPDVSHAASTLRAQFPSGPKFDSEKPFFDLAVVSWKVGLGWAERIQSALRNDNVKQAEEYAGSAHILATTLRECAFPFTLRYANEIDQAVLSQLVLACTDYGPNDPKGVFAREFIKTLPFHVEPSRKALDFAVCQAFEEQSWYPQSSLAARSDRVNEAVLLVQSWQQPLTNELSSIWRLLCGDEQGDGPYEWPQRRRGIFVSHFLKYQVEEAANNAMAKASAHLIDHPGDRHSSAYSNALCPELWRPSSPWDIAVYPDVSEAGNGFSVSWPGVDRMFVRSEQQEPTDRLDGTPEILPYPTRSKQAK